MNLVLFYTWEDAKVWTHWNYSLWTSALWGQYPVFSHSWVSKGAPLGEGMYLQWLWAWWRAPCFHPEMTWWLQHPLFPDAADVIPDPPCNEEELKCSADRVIYGPILYYVTRNYETVVQSTLYAHIRICFTSAGHAGAAGGVKFTPHASHLPTGQPGHTLVMTAAQERVSPVCTLSQASASVTAANLCWWSDMIKRKVKGCNRAPCSLRSHMAKSVRAGRC